MTCHVEILKDDLVRQWIAEGFVPEEHCLDLEEVAEGYFNELINRNMIQPVNSSEIGEVCSCRIHDLMLDLILLKCTEENFISTVDGLYNNMRGTSQVRRISHQIHTRNIPSAKERMSLTQVRSYMLHPGVDCVLALSKFQLLRVLHLDRGSVMGRNPMCIDLSGISQLFLLRYLKVKGFGLKLPNKFLRLHHLMTLDMETNISLDDSTNGSLDVTDLPSLRHLVLHNLFCVGLRIGVGKLHNLQTLYGFDISRNSVETIRDLGELTTLRELGLMAYSGITEEDSDTRTMKYNTLAASLRRLGNSNLRSLSVQLSATMEEFCNDCFTRPHHLRYLGWYNKTPQVPKWMLQADRLACIYRLEVEQFLSDGVQVLSQMPCLAYIDLQAEMLPEEGIVIPSNGFSVLKKFNFTYKSSCLTFEPGAMPQLKELFIFFKSRAAQHEVSPISGIEHLASLELVSLTVTARLGEGFKLESLCRDSIQRHKRYQSIKIDVHHFR